MQRVARAGQFDLDCASVGCAAVSSDESGLLHAVEVTGQGAGPRSRRRGRGRADFGAARS